MNRQEIKEWLDQYKVENYVINDDLTVDVNGDVFLYNQNLTELPFQFGVVKSYFICSWNNLKSLEHCPQVVHGDFICSNNSLKSLEHSPKIVHGNFSCSNNNLKSLEHSPLVHGNFSCDEKRKQDTEFLRWKLVQKLKEL